MGLIKTMVGKNKDTTHLVWEDDKCFLAGMGQTDCDGIMILKDVMVSGGEVEHGEEEGYIYHNVTPPRLTKIWVCNKCGFVFKE